MLLSLTIEDILADLGCESVATTARSEEAVGGGVSLFGRDIERGLTIGRRRTAGSEAATIRRAAFDITRRPFAINF